MYSTYVSHRRTENFQLGRSRFGSPFPFERPRKEPPCGASHRGQDRYLPTLVTGTYSQHIAHDGR